MAYKYVANTIVCDAGPNTVPGPLLIDGIQVPSGTTLVIADSNQTIETLPAGWYGNLRLRKVDSLTFTGACTLHLDV